MHIKQPYSYATLRMAFLVNPVSEILPNLDSPRRSVDLQICILNRVPSYTEKKVEDQRVMKIIPLSRNLETRFLAEL
jgi:hypothetical protein